MLTARLNNWRRQCESKFVFDAKQPFTSTFRQEVERRYSERIECLKKEAAKIKASMQTKQQNCSELLRIALVQGTQSALQRDQMKANITLIERNLGRR
jgi:ABC-type transporter MlaC component